MNDFEVIDAFDKAMREAGVVPVFKTGLGITADGKLTRFHIQGDDKGTRNGWAVLFGDGVPAGEFGSWKTGYVETWCAKDRTALSPDEQNAIKARIEQARIERDREQKAREGEAAKAANLLWNDATLVVDDDHPYLRRKGIRSHGLKTCAWPVRRGNGEVFRHIENTLLIPISNKAGKITSLQAIFPAKDDAFGRDKDFQVGGKKKGCFFVMGQPRAGQPVAICEGYATAETIHQATGWCVVVGWDAYNLPHVAKIMREYMPQATFVICADNDQFTKTPVDNPGLTYGKRAAAEVNGRLVWPEFADIEGKPTDFNDLAEREGIDVVQAQILPPLPKTLAHDPDGVFAGDLTAPQTNGYRSAIDIASVDTYQPFPEIDGKGKPIATIDNTQHLLDRIGAVIRYNVIAKDVEIIIPNHSGSVDNVSNTSHSEVMQWCSRFKMPTSNIDGFLLACADANQYNPVATWIGSKPWDGTSRLQAFYNTVRAKTDSTLPDGGSLKERLMMRWLVSAVAAAYSPDGIVARGVLTFISEQNLGKTYWLKRLAPKELQVIADGLILNPSDKDSVMGCVSKWIVELGEVDATFRKADIAALKAFISKDRDSLRRPYAKTESKFARRTVFFASVNDEMFLHDPTGNSRWWSINVEGLDNDHGIDMQQLWAEVFELFKGGESWHLTRDELAALNSNNREHEAANPVHDMIDKEFEWDASRTLWTVPMRATEIARGACIDKPTKKDVNEAAAYVVQRYGVEKRRVGKDRSSVWMMPSLKRNAVPNDRPF